MLMHIASTLFCLIAAAAAVEEIRCPSCKVVTDEVAMLQQHSAKRLSSSRPSAGILDVAYNAYYAQYNPPYTCESYAGTCDWLDCDARRNAEKCNDDYECQCAPNTCGINGTTCLPKECLGPNGPQPLCGKAWANAYKSEFTDSYAPAQCCQCVAQDAIDIFESGTFICETCINALNATVPGKAACAALDYPAKANSSFSMLFPYAKLSVLHFGTKWRGFTNLNAGICENFLDVADEFLKEVAKEVPGLKIVEKNGHVEILAGLLTKGACGLATGGLVVPACEILGVGPEDPLSDICAVGLGAAFLYSCIEAVDEGGPLTACAIANGFGCHIPSSEC